MFKNPQNIPYLEASALSADRASFPGYSQRSNKLFPLTLEPHIPHVMAGTIVEVNQMLQCYRVMIGGASEIIATSLETSGVAIPNSSLSSNLFGVGTSVLVMVSAHLGVNKGVILGAFPENSGLFVNFGSQELIPASPAGAGLDKISDLTLKTPFNNFNGRRPIDAYPTDKILFSSLGAGLFVGALQATLRASTECAVECHYIDSLLRLSSYNFEHFSAGADTQFVADCGDYTEIRRGNSYVIESVGGVEPYKDFPKKEGKERKSDASPSPDSGVYALEKENQIGWWRWLDLSGYLANVKLNFVLVPMLNKTREGANSSKDAVQDEVAVFREHVDSTGAYSVVSAKSISLIKDCLIPAPKEEYRADDSRGDKQKDIEEARESNKPNLVDAQIEGLDQEDASVLYSLASSDMASFKTHRSLVRFRERKNDWSLKEIDEVDLAGFKTTVASTGMLDSSKYITEGRMYAGLPQIGQLKINADENVNYFASRSMVMLHDDGSIHIQDGYGAAISMRGGCIDITCPGDITLRPGRNLVGLAGDSASIIGGVDVELCGMKGDIRVQADRNVSVLSGNDGQGGILLETRAQFAPISTPDDNIFQPPDTNANAYRGIWFKAAEAGVCTVANQAYVGNPGAACKVLIDSGKETCSIAGARSYILTEETQFITNPQKPENGTVLRLNSQAGFQMVTDGYFYFQGSQFLAAPKQESGDLSFYVQGDLNLLGTVRSEGIIVKQGTPGSSVLGGIPEDIYNDLISTPITEALSSFRDSVFDILTVQKQLFEAESKSLVKKPKSSLSNLVFYYPDSLLRSIPQDANYVLLEADWQRAYRAASGKQLTIRGVAKSGPGKDGVATDQSYCWPGAQALQSKFGKLKTDGNRYVTDKLAFKKDGFENPLQLLDNSVSFESNYTVIRANTIRAK